MSFVHTTACDVPNNYVENADDCDDTNNQILSDIDEDGDGFMRCFDCDDQDPKTYPGAASLDSEFACLTDEDGDGYGANSKDFGCFTISGEDDWGDGWNDDAYIDVVVDGVSEATFTVTEEEGLSAISEEICLEGTTIEFVYIEGEYTYENTYAITDSAGNILVEGMPSEGLLYDISFEGSIGTDCDDTNVDIGTGDLDGDGFDACNEVNPKDCDDTDPNINASIDADGDNFHACVDCDESNPDIHPEAIEIYYDGVDQNCDGLNDYDVDMDGYESIDYGGYDCDDEDETIHPADFESDPNLCFQDADGDGYGSMDISEAQIAVGIVIGTDCYDDPEEGRTPIQMPDIMNKEIWLLLA